MCDVSWFDKAANRLPEALWWSFGAGKYSSWRIDKLGRWVDPSEVIAGGNQHLHAAGQAVQGQDKDHCLHLEPPLDSPCRHWRAKFFPFQLRNRAPNRVFIVAC